MKKYDSIPRYGKQGTRDILGTEVVNDIFEEEMYIFLDMLRKKISKKTPIVVRELLEKWE